MSYLSDSNIQTATAHLIINCLRGNSNLVLYENPIQEIKKVCGELQDKVRGMLDPTNIEWRLPACMNPEMSMEFYERTYTQNWSKIPQVDPKEKEELINKVIKRYTRSKGTLDKKRLQEEMTDHSTVDQLKKWLNLTPKEMKLQVDEWSSFDLEDIINIVEQ